MKEDSEEYKLWCEIVNDISFHCGDDAICVIEKIERFNNVSKSDFERMVMPKIAETASLKVLESDTDKIVYLNNHRIYGMKPTGNEREKFFGICYTKEIIEALKD